MHVGMAAVFQNPGAGEPGPPGADDHLGKTRGYEHYGKMTEKIAAYGAEAVTDFFVELQMLPALQKAG